MKIRVSELMDFYEAEPYPMNDPHIVSADRITDLTMQKLGLDTPAVTPIKAGRRLGRTLLIAAVISLTLIATAMAVYQYVMRDAAIGEPHTQEVEVDVTEDGMIEFGDIEVVDLAKNGFADSPEYQAYTEWTEWNNAWWAEHENIFYDLGVDDSYHETPDNYAGFYMAYFPEQAEKLDEIMEKYGLTLHTVSTWFRTGQELYDVIGIEDILPNDFVVRGEYIYDDGTFKAYATLGDSDSLDECMDMFCAVKGSFTLIGSYIKTGYDEWAYTTADGTDLILATTENNTLCIANTEAAFITVRFIGITDKETVTRYADEIPFAELSRHLRDNHTEIAAAVSELAAKNKEDAEREAAYQEEKRLEWEERSQDAIEQLGVYALDTPLLPEPGVLCVMGEEGDAIWLGLGPDVSVIEVSADASIPDNDEGYLYGLVYSRYTKDGEGVNAEAYTQLLEEMRREYGSNVLGGITVNGYNAFIIVYDEIYPHTAAVIWCDNARDLVFQLTTDTRDTQNYSVTDYLVALAESVTQQ